MAFLKQAHNDFNILTPDIGNVHLNAPTAEKIYAMTWKQFSDDATGRFAVRALYELKSSGAAWHAFFADSLSELGFIPYRSDPDVSQ